MYVREVFHPISIYFGQRGKLPLQFCKKYAIILQFVMIFRLKSKKQLQFRKSYYQFKALDKRNQLLSFFKEFYKTEHLLNIFGIFQKASFFRRGYKQYIMFSLLLRNRAQISLSTGWNNLLICINLLCRTFPSFFLQKFSINYNMLNLPLILTYNQKKNTIETAQPVLLAEDLAYLPIDQTLKTLYLNPHHHPYILTPLHLEDHPPNHAVIINLWGKSLSDLSSAQLESYVNQSWITTVLTAVVELAAFLPKLGIEMVRFKNNEQPKFVPTKICSKEEYLQQARHLIATIFAHLPKIVYRSSQVSTINDFKQWQRELKPPRQPKSIKKLMELKLAPSKTKVQYRIALSEEQKLWILSQGGQNETAKMELVYDGDQCHYDPAPLLKVIQKKELLLLFLLQTMQGRRVAFWMAAKVQINPTLTFGQYYPDKTKKSVLLGLQKRSIHVLQQQAYSVGFGPQILLAIGKTDIVLSAFNCSNVSYFSCSYSGDDKNGVKSAVQLLGTEFTLRQLQVYRIN